MGHPGERRCARAYRDRGARSAGWRLVPRPAGCLSRRRCAQAGMSAALGRMATADEVATTVLFLASDLSSGITGQLLAVDAGIL